MIGNQKIGSHLILTVTLVLVASLFGRKYFDWIHRSKEDDDYELVRKYLLNESTLHGDSRPKIWIHSEHEINARKWKNFMSRNTTDVNQPYLYLTIQSIIQHCGEDFHICLIDDDSFEKILPTWDVDLKSMPENIKTKYRNIALLQVLHKYGGVIMPDSLLCLKSLKPLYTQCDKTNTPFMVEKIIRIPNSQHLKPYLPSMYCIGAKKNDPLLQQMMTKLTEMIDSHFHNETEFNSDFEQWCAEKCQTNSIHCVDGSFFGIKNKIGKPIIIDDLMSDNYLDVVHSNLYGIYIPKQEILKRPKFQYFSILPVEQILNSNHVLAKYFKTSIVDGKKVDTKVTSKVFNSI